MEATHLGHTDTAKDKKCFGGFGSCVFMAHYKKAGVSNTMISSQVDHSIWPDETNALYRSQIGPHAGGVTSIPGKQSVPVAVGGPGLACRSHFSRLAHIGKGGVGVGELFLRKYALSNNSGKGSFN